MVDRAAVSARVAAAAFTSDTVGAAAIQRSECSDPTHVKTVDSKTVVKDRAHVTDGQSLF